MPRSIRQQDVTTPHLRLPLTFGANGALVNEQGSSDDITDCIRAIIAYPIGYRLDNPAFGILDMVFKLPINATAADLLSALQTWETRAPMEINETITDDLVRQLILKVKTVYG